MGKVQVQDGRNSAHWIDLTPKTVYNKLVYFMLVSIAGRRLP